MMASTFWVTNELNALIWFSCLASPEATQPVVVELDAGLPWNEAHPKLAEHGAQAGAVLRFAVPADGADGKKKEPKKAPAKPKR